ncbi:DUF943 family protein [Enterobacter hormaechei]|uniref:DUF943 family protein n=1 Tax=Enterobacter hormaechei TaxID=158836 RepID=UPI003084EEE6|nr:DUF943 family protein [Enterobacter hormaechei]
MRNKYSIIILCLFLMAGVYNLWTLRPVNILHIDSDGGSAVVLVVDHLPWTDRGKIDWFLARREEVRSKYPLYNEGWHRYYIMGIGDGFTTHESSSHEDLLCFPVINSHNNCVIKDYLLIVDEYQNRNTQFYVSDADIEYQMTPDNKIEFVPRPGSLAE